MGILTEISKDKTLGEAIQCVKDIKEPNHISFGSFALNGIISGNVYRGIPDNTITALVGESNSGKSFLLAHLVRGAIQQGFEVLLFDSERAVRPEYYESIGCDTSKIFRVPVGSVSSLKHKANSFIKEFYARAGEHDKLFVGVDSIGNLTSLKEMNDIEKGKDVADQGSSAKDKNSAFRLLASLATDYDFPLVFTNHTYAAIGDLFAQRGKISGGSKAIYNSHIIIYTERLVNKEEIEDALGKKKKTQVGIRIKATTIKNREYPEEKTVYLDLRYDTGMNPLSGLLQFAIRAGVLENKPRGYLVTATGKTVFEKDLYSPEIFNKDALEKINDWLGRNGYSSLSDIFSDDVAKALGEENGKEETL